MCSNPLEYVPQVSSRPLDDYVAKLDPEFHWTDLGEERVLHGSNAGKSKSWVGHTLNLTSVRWLMDEDFHESSQVYSLTHSLTHSRTRVFMYLILIYAFIHK